MPLPKKPSIGTNVFYAERRKSKNPPRPTGAFSRPLRSYRKAPFSPGKIRQGGQTGGRPQKSLAPVRSPRRSSARKAAAVPGPAFLQVCDRSGAFGKTDLFAKPAAERSIPGAKAPGNPDIFAKSRRDPLSAVIVGRRADARCKMMQKRRFCNLCDAFPYKCRTFPKKIQKKT